MKKLQVSCAGIVKLFSVTFFIFGCVDCAPNYSYLKGTKYNVISEQITTQKPYLEVKNATYHAGPREEARAMCAVRTQEINATANATITRRLHGVVTSRELRSSIQRLEVIIYGQMQQLWQSLDALRAQLASGGRASARHLDVPDRRTVSFRYRPDLG